MNLIWDATMDAKELKEIFWIEVTRRGRADCWLKQFAPAADAELSGSSVRSACDGRIMACHLIPKQEIKRTVHRKLTENTPSPRAYELALVAIVYDPRVGVPGCERHHHQLDTSRRLKFLRKQLPAAVEEFAREHGLEAWLDREYGERLGV